MLEDGHKPADIFFSLSRVLGAAIAMVIMRPSRPL